MPRFARIVFPDVPHHITQRGNRRQNIFFEPSDYHQFKQWLIQYSNRYELDILAYCLMTNHVHIIATPRKPDSLARTLNIVHMRHSQSVNAKHGWNGHLWQARYFSTALDEKHLWLCLRYVEQNPVHAKMVRRAEDYPYSSAAAHCGLRDDPVLTGGTGFDRALDSWSEILKEVIDRYDVELIKRRTHSGTPCGDEKFLQEMGKLVGVDFSQKKKGRPRKEKASNDAVRNRELSPILNTANQNVKY